MLRLNAIKSLSSTVVNSKAYPSETESVIRHVDRRVCWSSIEGDYIRQVSNHRHLPKIIPFGCSSKGLNCFFKCRPTVKANVLQSVTAKKFAIAVITDVSDVNMCVDYNGKLFGYLCLFSGFFVTPLWHVATFV